MIRTWDMRRPIPEVIFDIGMYWRIIYGSFRLILGTILLRLIGVPSAAIFYRLMGRELIEDPDGTLGHISSHIVIQHPFTITYFLAAYLIFWGVLDILLSISMLRHKLWAFPISIVLIVLFIAYEIYRFTHTHSVILFGVIFIDILLIWIIRKEQQKLVLRIQRRLSSNV